MRTLLLFILSAGCGFSQILSGVLTAGGNAPTSAAMPTDSPGAGTYSSTQSVTLTTATSGATICYTTDGSTPGAAAPGTCDSSPTTTYSGAISVASTTTIKALATKAALVNSGVLTSVYTITIPISVVHSHFCPATTATGQTCTLGFTSSTANQIIIAWYGNDGTDATVAGHVFADGQGTTYTNFAASTHANGTFSFSYGYGFWIGKPAAAITTMTPNFTGGAGTAEYYVLEVSGLTTGSPTDVGLAVQSDSTISASSVGTPLSGSPASSNELALGFMVDRFRSTQTYSTPTNWTLISADADATNGATAVIWKQTPISGTPSTTNPVVTSTMGTAAGVAISIGVFK